MGGRAARRGKESVEIVETEVEERVERKELEAIRDMAESIEEMNLSG